MGARHKLNRAALNGALIVGAIFGAIAQSWLVFFVAAGLGVILSFVGGDFRPTKRGG